MTLLVGPYSLLGKLEECDCDDCADLAEIVEVAGVPLWAHACNDLDILNFDEWIVIAAPGYKPAVFHKPAIEYDLEPQELIREGLWWHTVAATYEELMYEQ